MQKGRGDRAYLFLAITTPAVAGLPFFAKGKERKMPCFLSEIVSDKDSEFREDSPR